MKEGYKVVAFIPARGGSKSIPFKNIKNINGRPLIYWVLDATVQCAAIEKVFVSTDSLQIKEVVEAYGSAKVQAIDRSEATATDSASTESALLEFAHNYQFQSVVLTQATSPLLSNKYLDEAVAIWQKGQVDSIVSVVRQKRFIWKEEENIIKPVNYKPDCRPRRQDFEGFLVENGAFYLTSRQGLLETKCRISGRIGFVEMSAEAYFEIDEPSDWIIVEQLFKKKNDSTADLKEKISKIKILLLDCDGVLTDGGMYYSENGDELKKFNTKDGMGIQILRENGIKVGIVTGEDRLLVKRRAEKLKLDELHLGVKEKLHVVEEIQRKYGFAAAEIAYIGDDLNDLPIMEKVGFFCSVADGMECIKEKADYVTKASGGQGAVREVAELILKYGGFLC